MTNHPNRSRKERRFCAKAGCNKPPNGIFSFCQEHNSEAVAEVSARNRKPLSDKHQRYRGEKVAVVSTTMSGKAVIEGYGIIRAAILGEEEHYRVQFSDGVFERYVPPLAQGNPQKYCDDINALRGTNAPVS